MGGTNEKIPYKLLWEWISDTSCVRISLQYNFFLSFFQIASVTSPFFTLYVYAFCSYVYINVSALMLNYHLTLIMSNQNFWLLKTHLTNCFPLGLLHFHKGHQHSPTCSNEKPGNCPSLLSFLHLPCSVWQCSWRVSKSIPFTTAAATLLTPMWV